MNCTGCHIVCERPTDEQAAMLKVCELLGKNVDLQERERAARQSLKRAEAESRMLAWEIDLLRSENELLKRDRDDLAKCVSTLEGLIERYIEVAAELGEGCECCRDVA